jgi:ribosomal peptide maturation radical SAM protein 1
MKKLLLLSMPYGALERQALGLSLFKARLRAEGFQCDINYLTFVFARLIGIENYSWFTNNIPHTAFAGEWTFTQSLYGDRVKTADGYIKTVLQGAWQLDNQSINRIIHAQKMSEYFLEFCMKTIRWKDYALVGFTSTFEQNISSLALAKKIKSEYPGIIIIFGGANWEGEMGMELHRQFKFVDYGFTGEADESFPALVKLLFNHELSERKIKSIPGIIFRSKGLTVLTSSSEPVSNLDKLPFPDYIDYFSEFDKTSTGSLIVPTLLFESARGCWWGDKNHCMFCGLNGNSMSFRAKSAKRVIEEIDYLSTLWHSEMLQAVDNVINMKYFNDLFPELSERNTSNSFFYEIRANLNREQVKKLSKAGVKNVQPGIESLNDNILKLMRKGTSTFQNIQVLKWCREYGINASWNLLYGFPGETDEDYHSIFNIIKKIKFLGAPTACGPIRLDRFSPYFREKDTFGFVNVRPLLPYKYLYPFGPESVSRIACYFDYDFRTGVSISRLSTELYQSVEEWQKNPERGTLQYSEGPDRKLIIIDSRSDAVQHTATLDGIDKDVYLFCDSFQTIETIRAHLADKYPQSNLTADQIQAFLNTLVNCGYQISDGKSYLSLALNTCNVNS